MSEEWSRFTDGLAQVLPSLPAMSMLIISDRVNR